MRGTHRHRLSDLLVHHHVDLDALLRFTKEETVEAVVFVFCGRAAEEEFGGEPPATEIDGVRGRTVGDGG
jgi:hypothetical protein